MRNVIKYKIVQKDHFEIPLDEDEVAGVKAALSSGGFIQTRAAIFDSSYVARLVVDDERTEHSTIKRVDSTGNVYYETEMLEDAFRNCDLSITSAPIVQSTYKDLAII